MQMSPGGIYRCRKFMSGGDREEEAGVGREEWAEMGQAL